MHLCLYKAELFKNDLVALIYNLWVHRKATKLNGVHQIPDDLRTLGGTSDRTSIRAFVWNIEDGM